MKNFYFSLVAIFTFTINNAQIVNIPDANFKAKLLEASSSNTIAQNLSGNYFKIDSNNDGEIQTAEANNVRLINVSNSNIFSMEGIEFFNNIMSINCSNNNISSLNFPDLYEQVDINCSYNQLTSFNFSTFHYPFFLNCSNNLISEIDLTSFDYGLGLTCNNNPIVNFNFGNYQKLIYLNCSNTLITILDLSSQYLFETLICTNNQNLNYLLIKGTMRIDIDMDYDYFEGYDFSNNPNLHYVCCSDDRINQVQNRVNYYGYINCSVNSYCSFSPSGTFYTIQGNSKLDFNSNGCDVSDINYPNMRYNITNGTITGSMISDDSGNYSIPVQSGTHTFTPQLENPSYFSVTPTTATVTFPATTSPFTQDFCLTATGVHHDLETVVIPVNVARPGFDAIYKIKYKNKGNQLTNASLSFNYNDAVMDYVSTSVVPASQSSGVINWNLGNLSPFDQGEIVVTLNLNSPIETPALNAGDILSFTSTISTPSTDDTPVDNVASLSQNVVNSFDPNDKRCLEGNTISPTKIGEYIHYMIRFENTGTFPAENIVVKDMIDTTKFDVSTLQMTDASHTCHTRINGGKVEFIFENINLPFDDANNDGYVVFKIKTIPTLTVGSQISNNANIYFDYNFPITTNTATSTFQTLANNDFEFSANFALSPVPAKDVLTITSKQNAEIYSIHIYNTLGQIVQTITQPSSSIDVSSLRTGTYLMKLITDKGISSAKFSKE